MNFQFSSDIFGINPVATCSLAFLLGICVGSFLNVLALRSLKEQSIIWPSSYCPLCEHALSPLDNIPVLSYFMLGGKCRYCKAPISWQYPFVEFCTGLVFVAIAFAFLVLQTNVAGDYATAISNADPYSLNGSPSLFGWLGAVLNGEAPDLLKYVQKAHEASHGALNAISVMPMPDFQKYGLAFGSFFFASVLIAVTITDFREKLIPHEITYPAMIIGIVFSTVVRGDFFGTMTGVGASYIIFDFMAFYGLKLYLATHNEDDGEESSDSIAGPSVTDTSSGSSVTDTSSGSSVTDANSGSSATDTTAGSLLTDTTAASALTDTTSVKVLGGQALSAPSDDDDEPIEVMGGGDAVLSAVMAAYLGWKLLIVALIIGFISGTVMGVGLLFVEMKKTGLLKDCLKSTFIWALSGFICFGGLTMSTYMLIARLDFVSALNPALGTGALGALGGGLLGTIMIGRKVSKPFPFGPALALGGFVAMFLIPFWCPFY